MFKFNKLLDFNAIVSRTEECPNLLNTCNCLPEMPSASPGAKLLHEIGTIFRQGQAARSPGRAALTGDGSGLQQRLQLGKFACKDSHLLRQRTFEHFKRHRRRHQHEGVDRPVLAIGRDT